MNPLFKNRSGSKVLGTFIDALDWKQSINKIIDWAGHHESRTVCLCNVHSSVTAIKEPDLSASLASSDMVLPDGAPIAWMLRRKGFNKQTRIAGPDLMQHLCALADKAGLAIYLFGSDIGTLTLLESNLKARYPKLVISGTQSPKFGTWSATENREYIDKINRSGAALIFIGLGCPKQEIWMAANKNSINAVQLGVGAAFDFHAGKIKRAPDVFQRLGLEWLHRLISEPRRLWRRYLVTNSRFIYMSMLEILKIKSY